MQKEPHTKHYRFDDELETILNEMVSQNECLSMLHWFQINVVGFVENHS